MLLMADVNAGAAMGAAPQMQLITDWNTNAAGQQFIPQQPMQVGDLSQGNYPAQGNYQGNWQWWPNYQWPFYYNPYPGRCPCCGRCPACGK